MDLAHPVPADAAAGPPAGRPPRLIQAPAGPTLGSDPVRRRAVGPIGGLIGRADPGALARLVEALGPGAQVLCAGPSAGSLIVDWDCCWLDGRPLRGLPDWDATVREGRLASVDGAFVLSELAPDGTLSLVRDAIGERTLYYAPLPDGFLFATTIRALLATGLVPRTLSPSAVATYLAHAYLPGRETMVDNIFELLPGEVLRFRQGRIERSQLWSLPAEGIGPSDEDAMRRELRACLEDAVRRRLSRGEAAGAFLSGGLDSSLVVALACRHHDTPLKTFSVSFGPGYPNELPFSSLVAEHCRTEHRIVELSPAVVLRHLDDTIGLLSEPIGDPLTVPNALLFREAAAEVGVILNGEGGDPCFGGPKNLSMVLAELYGGSADTPSHDLHARERSYLRAHWKCYDDLKAILAPGVLAASSTAALEERLTPYFHDPRWKSFVTRLQAINVALKGAHHILPKVDALSRPFGVVARSPLFDRAIVELSFALPPQLKLRGSVEKYLLKQAVQDLLPRSIIDRPKSGMLVPVEAWFQGPLLPQARERLLDGLAPWGLFQRDYLEGLLAGRLGGLRPRHGAKIWLLVTLEAWLRTVLGRA